MNLKERLFPTIPLWPGLLVLLVTACLVLSSCSFPFWKKSEESAPEYLTKTNELETHDCAKCHTKIFDMLQKNGGKHRIRCKRCHVKFHEYRPGKNKIEDVLPKCSQCHDKPHGDKLIECLNCHQQPHTPLLIPVSNTLTLNCDKCHPELDKMIKTFISMHANFYCTICHHTRHGYKPTCSECHMPHTESFFQPECVTCHNPHKPLQVTYPDDTPDETCAICHRLVYDTIKASHTKHTYVPCTRCHEKKHRTIPKCQKCHPQPHDNGIIEKAGVCGHCHGIAHSLNI